MEVYWGKNWENPYRILQKKFSFVDSFRGFFRGFSLEDFFEDSVHPPPPPPWPSDLSGNPIRLNGRFSRDS